MPRLRSFRSELPCQSNAVAQLGRILSLIFLVAGSARGAGLPAYLSAALARFNADVPPGWAYTVSVTRGDESSVEGFDPGRPAGRQWTLLKRGGRAPTPDEKDRYDRYRETNNASAAARATYERGDLDFASAEVVHEDAAGATVRCRFRTDAAEPMLSHLELFLSVSKDPAAIAKTVLHLTRPYSPVLGMKMNELEVTVTFSRPADGQPGLPLTAVSRFHGRILWFWSVDEESRVSYSDYHRASPPAGRASRP